jgi:hypothetical protein
MASAVPVMISLDIHKPNKRFMNEGRCLERLARFLLGHLRRSQLPQLFIDKREKLFGGVGIAVFNSREDPRDFGHGRCPSEVLRH